ncbi:hypothetical protein DYB38_002078 [Aphanomyces astaci]|uniref:Uncharacterized protein n=1 Tax=Aphanomyces astaci TaxID=112090 RepID=A0A397CKN5_APHAT|nr:hypothetical protein DYB38_002078 [Aphanomyces astaci]
MDAIPTKEAIQDAFHGTSTRRPYSTYQRQFLEYFQHVNSGKDPCATTTGDCTDFLHHLPAEIQQTEQPPLSAHELSLLMNSFGDLNPFVGTMFRFLFSMCYLGCFRISEVLALRWPDLARAQSEAGVHVSVRLRWHKKASVEQDCQIYNLVDEVTYPCLRVCGFYDDYLSMVKATMMNVADNAVVFPQVTHQHNGTIKVSWDKAMEQNYLRRCLNDAVERCPQLSTNVSLHSMRRGGSFYRVFESQDKRFNFRELMAWCRWGDAKICCEYLVTKNLSDEVDPRNLLLNSMRARTTLVPAHPQAPSADSIAEAVIKMLQDQKPAQPSKTTSATKQTTLDVFVVPKTIPSARSAHEAWCQWFYADVLGGRPCALNDFTKEMIKADRKKYSERVTLSLAFKKFQTYELFGSAYAGHAETYRSVLKEARQRKRENKL